MLIHFILQSYLEFNAEGTGEPEFLFAQLGKIVNIKLFYLEIIKLLIILT